MTHRQLQILNGYYYLLQHTGDPCLERRRFFTTVMIISPEEGLRSLPRRSLYHPLHGCDHNREMRRRHDLNWSCGV
ncbi:hypothetical protein DY000_02057957 [Brassica cretica]|uniref:Uncharacterized protein n=1 Tax=Brassica cretica TaxID=69181 RepID=A0ABQ7ALJ8_BRACR|nr:hypothetical protein DY000_02057957 [Brassica cretica]